MMVPTEGMADLLLAKDLVIFDADGTLCGTRSGKPFRENAQDWVLLPNRGAICEVMRDSFDLTLAIASNQGGVAFGYLKEAEIRGELRRLASSIGTKALYFCPHHPQGTIAEYRREDPWRKPGPGMLEQIMVRLDIGPRETLMVGDRPEDQEAAKAAKVDFFPADLFFDAWHEAPEEVPVVPIDSRIDTYQHILMVQARVQQLVIDLLLRANVHDQTKLVSPEKEAFDTLAASTRAGITYGTQEYTDLFKDIKPAIAHHYAHNSHHPEHHEHGVRDMDLVDLLEMVCDWSAASRRHNGSLLESLPVNQERFGLSDDLTDIIRNTIEHFSL